MESRGIHKHIIKIDQQDLEDQISHGRLHRRWNVDGPLQTPKGIREYSNILSGVVNTVLGWSCSRTAT